MSSTESTLLLVSALVLVSCRGKPIVAIDHAWNVDFAKNACWSRKNSVNPCVGDPTPEVNDFERRLVTSFASEPACKDVLVIGPEGKTANEQYWLLMLDFQPGDSAQGWSIIQTDRHRAMRQGEGNPDQIATPSVTP